MEKITDKLAALPPDGCYFSLEFFPPKTQMGFANLQNRLARMANALRPLFVTVTWGAGGSTASKSLELAERTQRQLGLTTCLHLTCTNMNRALVDEALEQAKALGVRNILALRGDAPRVDEYRSAEADGDMDSNKDFSWAIDLVRYIRQTYGDYFCIGVAAYPEGHSDQSHPDKQDPAYDLPYLIEKTKAGADFIMTQLFFDIIAYERFEDMLRRDPSGVFKTIPIIPGLMPIQSYQILRRTTKLSHATLPPEMLARIDAVKGDDEAVKSVGVDLLSQVVQGLKARPNPGPRGFHFYTLNLEKAVAHIVERCHLTPSVSPDDTADEAVTIDDIAVNGDGPVDSSKSKNRRRLSSVNSTPHNRVVVDRASTSSKKSYEALADEAGVPKDKIMTRANTLAISEGEGSLGREATWDDFPNGRWGDARSPAYGEIDGYGVSLHVSIPQATRLWKYPTTVEDISDIFRRHVAGEIEAIPWSEEGLSPETETIREPLTSLISKGWWSVASQPAVNGVKSTDETFGWGPKKGYVFQKPFVELFIPSADWKELQARLDKVPDVTYYAGNHAGQCLFSHEDSVNPVTWGTFTGKEIVSPTIIEAVSFRAWLEEAFSIWSEWKHVYPPGSATAKLLDRIRDEYWLVNIIHHNYLEGDALWRLLLAE